MIDQDTKDRILDLCSKPYLLGGWLGIPYEEDGCIKFCVRFYKEMGIQTDDDALKQAHNFIKVEQPEFGDIAVFYSTDQPGFHVGIMVDQFNFMQCSVGTNGVARQELSRYPWHIWFKAYYRHKSLCS